METKHTPGPWKYDDGHIYTKNKHGNNSKYNSIATVHDIYDDKGIPQCNWKVIVAAPSLLEALLLIYEEDKINAILLPEMRVKMKNALKQATE